MLFIKSILYLIKITFWSFTKHGCFILTFFLFSCISHTYSDTQFSSTTPRSQCLLFQKQGHCSGTLPQLLPLLHMSHGLAPPCKSALSAHVPPKKILPDDLVWRNHMDIICNCFYMTLHFVVRIDARRSAHSPGLLL